MFLQRQPTADAQPFKAPAYGLMALNITPSILAFFVLQSLVPVLSNGLDLWLGSILPVIALAAVVSSIFVFGLIGRQPWYASVAQVFGWMLMVGYAAGFVLSLAILVGIVPKVAHDLGFISVINTGTWVLFSPITLLLWRVTHRESWRRLPAKA